MRRSTKKVDIIIIAVILLLIAGGILLALLTQNEQHDADTNAADTDGDGNITYKDYIGKRVGVITGSSFEEPTFEFLPDSEYLYYDTLSDVILALKQEKIDCFICDEPILRMVHIEQPEVGYLSDVMKKDDYSFAFSKNNERTDHIMKQFNEMLSELASDGTLEKMKDKWFSEGSEKNRVDLSGFDNTNDTLNIVTLSTNVPFSMVADGELTGYSIELVAQFCRRYGYDCKFDQTSISSALAGISTGIYDMLASCATVTEERKESMNFSDPIYVGGITLAVRSADLSDKNKLTLSDFNGKNIAVQTGTSHDVLISDKLPDAHISYYNDYSFLIEAVKSGKADAFVADNAYLDNYIKNDSSVSYLDEPINVSDVGYIFTKNEKGKKLCDEVSAYVTRISEDGRLQEMYDMWSGTDESVKIPFDTKDLDNRNGTIKMAADFNYEPLIYMKEGKYAGFELYLIYNFCRENGYGLEIMSMSFDGILPAVTSEVCDIGASAIVVTPERQESVYFSVPHYRIKTVLGVPSGNIVKGKITSDTPLSYFDDKKIGILTGSAYEPVAQKIFPDAEYMYFDVASDLALATVTGKIDGYLMASDQAETMKAENPGLFWLKEAAEDTAYAFAFPKTENGAALRNKINAFLAKIKADGTMEALLKKWTEGEIEQYVDMTGFTGENGVLRIACDATTPPWEYTYNGEVTGYEIELVAMFCREYGYIPDFDTMTFSAVIPGIASEKYDMAAANITVTAERAESVYFSDKESGSTVVFVTAAVGAESQKNAGNEGFFDSIAASFEKNFIREDRWKMIAEGIGTTCFITVMSALFGSVFAFLVCMFRRTGSTLANAISNIYVKLLQGTPIVVLLMILYYVLLGKSGLVAVWVAIIGFSLNFGAYASEIMRSGIESIDGGQREAALALGYSENQAFFRFIFPQAAVRFLPVYRGEIVSLLKSTSIVGYIAIQDLTKMSDIIRSRTYEAFFPLIATAVIYFILAWIISLLLKIIMNAVDKRHKRRSAAK